jgi:hypothetical protein
MAKQYIKGDINKVIAKMKKYKKGGSFLILAMVLLISAFLFVLYGDFCSIDMMCSSDKKELSRLITSIAFPMTGVLTFVLTQALKLCKDYEKDDRTGIKRKAKPYHYMCWVSGVTIVGCAVTGLLSMQYFKSTCDIYLISALCLLLSILVVFILNILYFCIYTLIE